MRCSSNGKKLKSASGERESDTMADRWSSLLIHTNAEGMMWMIVGKMHGWRGVVLRRNGVTLVFKVYFE